MSVVFRTSLKETMRSLSRLKFCLKNRSVSLLEFLLVQLLNASSFLYASPNLLYLHSPYTSNRFSYSFI